MEWMKQEFLNGIYDDEYFPDSELANILVEAFISHERPRV